MRSDELKATTEYLLDEYAEALDEETVSEYDSGEE